MKVDGAEYSGYVGAPTGKYAHIVWSTNQMVNGWSGWKLCKTTSTWSITGNGCEIVGDCISSTNYDTPGNDAFTSAQRSSSTSSAFGYNNNEHCTVDILEDVFLTFDGCETEEGWDILKLDGIEFSGSQVPPGGQYTHMIWNTDSSVRGNPGWKICKTSKWIITGSGCVMDGGCISSKNYYAPGNEPFTAAAHSLKQVLGHSLWPGYDNNEYCRVDIFDNILLMFEGFETEQDWDILELDGIEISGWHVPSGGQYTHMTLVTDISER